MHYPRMTSPFERPGPAKLPPLPRAIRRALFWIVGVLAVALIVIPWLATFATDWFWFKEIGFQSVFLKSLFWRVGLFILGAGFTFAYFYGNVRLARGVGTRFPVLYVNRGDGVTVDVSRTFTRLFFPIAIVLSFVTAISFSASWMMVLKAMNGVAAGTTDPLFGRDVSFYLFRLPLISAVLGTLITLTFLSLVACVAMYWMANDITLPPRRASAKPRAARHLGALLAFFFVLLAVRHWIVGTASLLYSTTGPRLQRC